MDQRVRPLIQKRPFAAIWKTKAEIHRLLRMLAAEGVGILMIASELPEIFKLSDRVLVLSEGRIVADLPVQEATPEGVMTYATAGPAR